MSSRWLSHTEIETALTCFARWDYSYGGYRTGGTTLKPKVVAPILSQGRAWGAGVAAWHAHHGELRAGFEAHRAIITSLTRDLAEMEAAGVEITQDLLNSHKDTTLYLSKMLDHHMSIAKPLPGLTRLEGEFNVPIPSRTGERSSSRYRLHGYLDGFRVDEYGLEWLYECKLRGQIQPPWLLHLSNQLKWYAVGRAHETGIPVVGVIIDQRLNAIPKPPKIVYAKRKGEGVDGKTVSHDKAQFTTPELYIKACKLYDVEPQPDVVEALGKRVWHHTYPITFRPDELAEARADLVSAAKVIRDLDSGELTPIRNATAGHCKSCRFREICHDPSDTMLVDQLFARGTPKRLRGQTEAQEAPVAA